MLNRFPIAVLISGGGTTLRNLIHWIEAGKLDVEIRWVVSSSADAGGIHIAEKAKIPTSVISRKGLDPDAHSEKIFGSMRRLGVELVVMGGYLQHLLIPPDFDRRVINIHPSLIPSFCGKGMYGLRVHQAAIDFGVRISGCTVHYVDNEYDHGPIISQLACSVLETDTAEILQRRVFELECRALPEAIGQIASKWYSAQPKLPECN